MRGRFEKEKFILYLSILVAYLIFWIHNDLAIHPDRFMVSAVNNTWQVVFALGINLLYFEYIVPFVTAKKHYRLLWIVTSLIIHLSAFVAGLYVWHSLGTAMGIYRPFQSFVSSRKALADIGRFTPGAFLLFAVFKLFFDYTRLKYEGQQVRLEKKQAELVFLKSQINPHFLFNTLNNIYSLSQYEPHLVSESVLRLSKILRYMLYETDNERTQIDKEIKILHDYIDLEKLRYSESVSIEFKHTVENPFETMPPLLLLPLVENAFKHGVSESKGKRFIYIDFIVQQGQLAFIVKNSCSTATQNGEVKEGIGLFNLKRRLHLLYKEFYLVVERKDSIFTTTLNVNLESHV